MTGIVRVCPEMASFWYEMAVGVFWEFSAKNSNHLSARHPGVAASEDRDPVSPALSFDFAQDELLWHSVFELILSDVEG